MPKLPRHTPKRASARGAKGSDKGETSGQDSAQEIALRAAEHQAAIQIAAAADMPLPESYFHGVFFSKQVFDDAYRALKITPTYVGRERYIRPSVLRQLIEKRASNGLPTSFVSNLPAGSSPANA